MFKRPIYETETRKGIFIFQTTFLLAKKRWTKIKTVESETRVIKTYPNTRKDWYNFRAFRAIDLNKLSLKPGLWQLNSDWFKEVESGVQHSQTMLLDVC